MVDRGSPCRARARRACPISPPKASTIAWWPRQTPSVGTAGAAVGRSQARARGGGPAGAGGEDEVGGQSLRLVRVDRVVAAHDDLRAELAEEVREVVGERVVVVDQQDHALAPRRARSPARARPASAGTRRARRRGRSRRRSRRPPVGSATPSCQHDRADCDAGVERPAGQRIADGAGVGAAAVALQLGDQLHRPHLRRARDGPGGEAGAQEVEGRTPSPSSPTTSETRWVTCEKRSGSRKRVEAHRPGRQTRERSLRPRSTSITCSARSFSEPSSRSASPSPGRGRPGDRVQRWPAALDLDERLRRGADQREPVELEQEEVRRGVDAAQ